MPLASLLRWLRASPALEQRLAGVEAHEPPVASAAIEPAPPEPAPEPSPEPPEPPAPPPWPLYPQARRERLLAGLDLARLRGAEIGPLHNPLVAKSDGPVLYVDHCDTETLRAIWAKDPSVDIARLHVDVPWRRQTFAEALAASAAAGGPDATAPLRLDYVVASHVIEHVPDLIGWLQQIAAVLTAGGQLRLAVPDRRFTFDQRRRTSALKDVLAAYVERAQVPSAACILDHTLNMATVDVGAAWRGELELASQPPIYAFDYCLATARDAFENGSYHDFHCWVFTPRSFLALLLTLAERDLQPFACERFDDTPLNDFEFILHLGLCEDRERRADSWRQALATARQYAFAPEAASD